jgi:hypothetical protein
MLILTTHTLQTRHSYLDRLHFHNIDLTTPEEMGSLQYVIHPAAGTSSKPTCSSASVGICTDMEEERERMSSWVMFPSVKEPSLR